MHIRNVHRLCQNETAYVEIEKYVEVRWCHSRYTLGTPESCSQQPYTHSNTLIGMDSVSFLYMN